MGLRQQKVDLESQHSSSFQSGLEKAVGDRLGRTYRIAGTMVVEAVSLQ
jgi:hypothetical protein